MSVEQELTADQITMMCIRFCEEKGGNLINSQMSLSTIEYIKDNRKEAIKKLKDLVKYYGNAEDREKLLEINIMIAEEKK